MALSFSNFSLPSPSALPLLRCGAVETTPFFASHRSLTEGEVQAA